MPYEGEFATGETLVHLVRSAAVSDFEGQIRTVKPRETSELPERLEPQRSSGRIRSLVAFDGSTVTGTVRNGYPGAEAALVHIAAVVVFLDRLRELPVDPIPGPAQIRKLEECHTLSAVLPGRNVVGPSEQQNTPKRFFRTIVHEQISGATLATNHETLLETLESITRGRRQVIKCPSDDCDEGVIPDTSVTYCQACGEQIYPTDSLRAHERFEDHGSSEQAFTMVRIVVEHLAMLNVVRWLEQNDHLDVLDSVAFVVDGPLAVFGMAAWLKYHIQQEVARIHRQSIAHDGSGILLMGVEKSGLFMDHLEALDWTDPGGTRSRIPPATVLTPDLEYIHRHIALRPLDAKPYGSATYYGRKVMYKTAGGQHTVFTLPIVNEAGQNLSHVDSEAYPRLGDALDLIDELGVHLYKDGFAPLVRAHLHAAIPLRRGTEILASLFEA